MEVNLGQLMQSAGLAVKMAREAQQAATHISGQNQAMQAQIAELVRNAQELRAALSQVQVMRGGGNGDPHIQRVENIPGRRVPLDLLVDIPIGAGVSSVQQGTITIPQDGPVIAVARYATFVSAFEFQVTDPESESPAATFQGRSFGRYRPIHSAWDLNDGQPLSTVSMAQAFPGTGAPHIASPSNASSFRTMQPDFRILFENAGSGVPRQNLEVPSTFWTKAINEPMELPCLDVFERGEVLTFKAQPLHINNPDFGNISGFGAPNPNYPFIASQYDVHEGIDDQNNAAAGETDPVTRLPNGILTIGFFCYLIRQPAGAGPY